MTFFPTKKFIFNCFLTLRRKRWSEEDDKGGQKQKHTGVCGCFDFVLCKNRFFF